MCNDKKAWMEWKAMCKDKKAWMEWKAMCKDKGNVSLSGDEFAIAPHAAWKRACNDKVMGWTEVHCQGKDKKAWMEWKAMCQDKKAWMERKAMCKDKGNISLSGDEFAIP